MALDLSGRPYFAYEGGPVGESIAGFDTGLVAEFFRAVVNNARMTMHVRVLSGGDVTSHHRGGVQGLRQGPAAGRHRPIRALAGIPSTKGVL